jgi:hypothetical protein
MSWRTIVLAWAVLAVVGCSTASGPTGTVTGTYTQVGGPSGAPDVPLSGTVSFRASDGSTRRMSSDAHGKFAGQLPPGTYTVTAKSSLVNDGTSTCSQSLTTRVQAGKTVSLTIICNII